MARRLLLSMHANTYARAVLTSRSSRWPVVVSALTAVALMASTWLSWAGVHAAANTVARGDAEAVTRAIERILDRTGRPPTQGELNDVLTSFSDDGVVFLAILDERGEMTVGTPMRGLRALPHAGDLDHAGPSWRVVTLLGPARQGRPRHPGKRPEGHHRPPRLVVELVPETANALEERAMLTLAVGAVAALLVIITSLAWRRAARDREEARARSAENAHLSSLGEMSAVLAHEIRNPLASLKGHAQLLEESLEEGSKARIKAERVVHEALRIEHLTTDLLAFVRSGALARSHVDPRAVARDAIAASGHAARITLVADAAPARAHIDAERVRGAIENLLRNAGESAPDAPIILTLSADLNALVFEVRDAGPGIPRDQLERIFAPFHTTRTQGTGLGLAVARRIAQAHGGSLVARNETRGACFTLRLADALTSDQRG